MPHTDFPSPPDPAAPWVVDTRDLGRRPGAMRTYQRSFPAPAGLRLDLEGVPAGSEVELGIRVESVVEGVLVTGTVRAPVLGECARCLDPVSDRIEVEFTELFAYPDSTTDESTEDDEVSRVVEHLVDLHPVLHDAVVLALPQVPVCAPDCAGLCAGCGARWAELEPEHRHEMIDPRWAALQDWFGAGEKESE